MGASHTGKSSGNRLLQKLLKYVSLEWLSLLPDLYRLARRWVKRSGPEGLYEILDYDSTLELLDAEGQTAIFKKRQRVKILQDYTYVFPDFAWGDGEIFADYRCSPGVVVDKYKEGDRWNVLISFRETKNAGDVVDINIHRTVKGGFTQAEESRQIELRHQTRRLRVTIIFPKERPCRRAVLLERSRNQTTVLGPEHFTRLPEPDGRQALTWETTKIKRFEIYTLKWSW